MRILNGVATPTALTITWEAEPGFAYRIQYKDEFTESTWKDLGSDVTATDVQGTKTDDTVGGIHQRFYRVLQLSPP